MAAIDLAATNRMGPASQSNKLLRDFLEPDSEISIEAAKDLIFTTLPHHEPDSDESWLLANDITGISRCIPADSPVMNRLVELTLSLTSDPRWKNVEGTNTYGHFSMALRDQFQAEQEEMDDPSDFSSDSNALVPDLYLRNFSAYQARMAQIGPRDKVNLVCIWVFEAAHEGGAGRFDSTTRDGWVLAAAEWIKAYGKPLYESSKTDTDNFMLYCGPLWEEKAKQLGEEGVVKKELPYRRWLYWIERFRGVESGSRGDCQFAEVTRQSASMAASTMERLGT